MDAKPRPPAGAITWRDLTVEDAARARAFYAAVVGWESVEHPMGEYADWSMKVPATGEVVAGICHARGPNAGLPPQWLLYVQVDDLGASLASCRALGGAVLQGPRDMGPWGRLAVIRDPAGAALALMEAPPAEGTGASAAG
jgi:predicted enzyme related to lactoylglutathione lyase